MKTIAKPRESDKGGRAEVKRIAMLLSVVALMVVMMAMGVSPAFAAWYQTSAPGVLCREGGYPLDARGETDPLYVKTNRNNDWYVCYSPSNNRLYDNRIA
jgi:hypothetical protein